MSTFDKISFASLEQLSLPRTRRDIKEGCIEEAFRFLQEHEPAELSLREIARRLGVTHQAPYKHFRDRDHLLAVVTARAFSCFADALEKVPTTPSPQEDLRALGNAYLAYAANNQLHYRLMFGARLDSVGQDEQVVEQAMRAFNVLVEKVARLRPRQERTETVLDSLSLWSTVHGIASIHQSGMLSALGIPEPLGEARTPNILARIVLADEAES